MSRDQSAGIRALAPGPLGASTREMKSDTRTHGGDDKSPVRRGPVTGLGAYAIDQTDGNARHFQ